MSCAGQPDDKLDHILVLHVEGGSDFFISIMGTYTLSSFGLSLKNLALQAPRDETPVRRESKAKLPSMRYRERGTSAVSLEVPVCEESSLDFDDHFFTRSVPVEPIELKRSTSLAATGQCCIAGSLEQVMLQVQSRICWKVRLEA